MTRRWGVFAVREIAAGAAHAHGAESVGLDDRNCENAVEEPGRQVKSHRAELSYFHLRSELQVVQAALESANAQLVEQAASLSVSVRKIQGLTVERDRARQDLAAALRSHEAACEKLDARVSNLTRDLEASRSELGASNEQVAELQTQLEGSDRRAGALAVELDQLRPELHMALQEVERLARERRARDVEFGEALERAEAVEARSEAVEAEHARLWVEFGEALERAEASNARSESLGADHARLSSELAKALAGQQAALAELDTVRQALDELRMHFEAQLGRSGGVGEVQAAEVGAESLRGQLLDSDRMRVEEADRMLVAFEK